MHRSSASPLATSAPRTRTLVATGLVALLGLVGCSGGASGSSSPKPSNGAFVAPTSVPSGRACPAGAADSGISANEVKIAVTVVAIAGASGNAAVGVPSPEEQEKDWKVVIDAFNAEGGAGCRKIVPTFYRVNPIDASDAQAKCLAIAGSKPFLALDSGSLAGVGAADCIPKQKIPLLTLAVTPAQVQKYYPYYLGTGGPTDKSIRTGILAFKQGGYFSSDKGFAKLGILYRTCQPAYYEQTRKALTEAGVPDSAITSYNLGCPASGSNTPADLQQAVLSFKRAGVTHVTEANVADFVLFTKPAAQQKFTPQYLIADDGVIGASSGTTKPDANNFNGAVAIAGSRYAENTTPGFTPSGPTATCDSIYTANGIKRIYDQPAGYGGIVCSLLTVARALLDNVSEAKREQLVNAYQKIGQLDLAYPSGPVDFTKVPAGTPYGSPLWRTLTYVASCTCFQVVDPKFQPEFP